MVDRHDVTAASMLFNAAGESLKRGNFEYAAQNFLKCVKLVPDRMVYRQALRGAQRKMYDNNRKGAPMAKMKMMKSLSLLQLSKTRKKWTSVIEYAEDCLMVNPWDGNCLKELGYALYQNDFYDQAVWTLELAYDAMRDSKSLLKLMAEVYEEAAQYGKAIKCWEAFKKIVPKSELADDKLRELSATKTISEGKYEQSTKTVEGEDGQSASAANESIVRGETSEQKLQREIEELQVRIADEPGSAELYLRLGDLLRKNNRHEEAIGIYNKGLQASGGGSFDLRTALMDCEIQPLRENMSVAKNKLASVDPSDSEEKSKLEQQVLDFQKEIGKREVELMRMKTEMNPSDYESFYFLGIQLIEAEQFGEAIKALQQGRNDPKHRWEALMWLGYSFWKKGNHSLASRNLIDALDTATDSNEKAKKQINYYLGRIAEEQEDYIKAIEHYNDIAAIDFDYEDVEDRLDQLNTKR